MQDIIDKIKKEFSDVEQALLDPNAANDMTAFAANGRKRAQLEPVMSKISGYESAKATMTGNASIINEETDEELIAMALEENEEVAAKLPRIEKELEVLLLPKDPLDDKNIIVEIRGGAGGDESAIFAADLFRMYTRFAEIKGWKMEMLSESRNDVGGFKEVIFSIVAKGDADPVYSSLKFESGVHRVQRIPETEKQGRIHTSTATVAILAEAEEVDIVIENKDLRIDTFAASGPGGQSVNTTMSAVRITHIPTNTVVSCQDGKSQHQNKDQAMKVLRSRILQKQAEEAAQEASDARKSQVGTGDRSEKIRTYNVPQDRVTDHRIGRNWSSVEKILSGEIADIVTALQEENIRIQLEQQS